MAPRFFLLDSFGLSSASPILCCCTCCFLTQIPVLSPLVNSSSFLLFYDSLFFLFNAVARFSSLIRFHSLFCCLRSFAFHNIDLLSHTLSFLPSSLTLFLYHTLLHSFLFSSITPSSPSTTSPLCHTSRPSSSSNTSLCLCYSFPSRILYHNKATLSSLPSWRVATGQWSQS